MLYKLILDGYGSEEEYNCAEKILYGANKAYNLGLNKEALVMSGGFGGGMGVESTCGALTGAIMAIGSYIIDSNAKSTNIRDLVVEYLNTYEDRMGSIYCDELKDKYFNDDIKCQKVVEEAAKLLDEIYLKIK